MGCAILFASRKSPPQTYPFSPTPAYSNCGSALVVAADSATAAIFAGGVSGLATPASAGYVALAGMVALLTAVILLLARLLRLGFIADFLSRTVLVGFLRSEEHTSELQS